MNLLCIVQNLAPDPLLRSTVPLPWVGYVWSPRELHIALFHLRRTYFLFLALPYFVVGYIDLHLYLAISCVVAENGQFVSQDLQTHLEPFSTFLPLSPSHFKPVNVFRLRN